MYIQITVDLNKYNKPPIEIRLSDQHYIKKLIDITWKTVKLEEKPREGHWIRVKNRDEIYLGVQTLKDCGITTGDCVEVL
ncbi:EsaB/YukD family protein [Oceanobacillus halophilus]|uniref:Ubiquitin n=1 Tax=Oceanobacillus halophilus TaxID=930130 RepID=A0A495A4C2_9BACI|nr:EsaB/YukD family protein [Oceanobacillus halophilus]RKQ33910.1 ubiquitin [Oceanobacillus halophilus]